MEWTAAERDETDASGDADAAVAAAVAADNADAADTADVFREDGGKIEGARAADACDAGRVATYCLCECYRSQTWV